MTEREAKLYQRLSVLEGIVERLVVALAGMHSELAVRDECRAILRDALVSSR